MTNSEDITKKIPEYRELAEKGDVNAQLELAKAYLYGEAGKVDGRESMYWCAMALQAGSPLAKVFYGTYHFMGLGVPKNYEIAFRWWHEAAQDGSNEGAAFTAWAYSQGVGIEKSDVLAYEWWQKAARHGVLNAQISIAKCYEEGLGTQTDHSSALFWYSIAKRNGGKDSLDADINKIAKMMNADAIRKINCSIDEYISTHPMVISPKQTGSAPRTS